MYSFKNLNRTICLTDGGGVVLYYTLHILLPVCYLLYIFQAEHAVTPVPVQPNGTLFYRAKQFYKRNLWAFIYEWEKNLFRFMVKHIHASTVGRADNCNLVIAHVQYIGPDSMAAQYAYQISLFDCDNRKNGPKFEGIVSSTMKPLESQVTKEEVFVATTYTARDFTDTFGQLNFIIQMRSFKEKDGSRSKDSESRRHRSRTSANPQPGPSGTQRITPTTSSTSAVSSSTLSSSTPSTSSTSSTASITPLNTSSTPSSIPSISSTAPSSSVPPVEGGPAASSI